jgi:hypothetical protein
MAVRASLPLFPKPGEEIEVASRVNGDQLRDLAEAMWSRLRNAAEILDRLLSGGWNAEMGTNGFVKLDHPDV